MTGAGPVARWADRWGPAAGYAAALVVAGAAMAGRGPAARAAWLDGASTNLANLAVRPALVLPASAVLTTGSVAGWVLLAVVGLGTCGYAFGARRTLLLVAAAHIGGTAVSEGVVAWRIAHGLLPASAVHLRDVGPSYVVAAAVAAGLAYGPRLGRLACGAALVVLLPGLFGGLSRLEVAPVGHVCAIAVALALGAPLRWRPGGADPDHGPGTDADGGSRPGQTR
jgi:hypothetical protein